MFKYILNIFLLFHIWFKRHHYVEEGIANGLILQMGYCPIVLDAKIDVTTEYYIAYYTILYYAKGADLAR